MNVAAMGDPQARGFELLTFGSRRRQAGFCNGFDNKDRAHKRLGNLRIGATKTAEADEVKAADLVCQGRLSGLLKPTSESRRNRLYSSYCFALEVPADFDIAYRTPWPRVDSVTIRRVLKPGQVVAIARFLIGQQLDARSSDARSQRYSSSKRHTVSLARQRSLPQSAFRLLSILTRSFSDSESRPVSRKSLARLDNGSASLPLLAPNIDSRMRTDSLRSSSACSKRPNCRKISPRR